MLRKSLSIQRQFSSFSSRIIDSELSHRLKHYESQKPTPNTIQHFINLSGDRAALYNLIRGEIPVRLSRIVPSLPQYFSPAVYQQRTSHFLQDYFEMTFKEIEQLPPRIDSIDKHIESKFLEVLVRAGIRLRGTTEMVSESLLNSGAVDRKEDIVHLQPVLTELFHRNLSIDVLVNIYKPKWTKKINNSTGIDPANDLVENIEAAFDDARYLCEQQYISAPEIVIENNTDCVFSCIPSHNYLIFFEIFKNSLRATAETHSEEDFLPPVEVNIGREEDRVLVTISDRGGGMSPSKLERSKQFFSSSAILSTMSLYQGAHSSPLAGFGFGLGMAKIYAEYFGGSFYISSEEGKGTKVQIELPANATSAIENLQCYS